MGCGARVVVQEQELPIAVSTVLSALCETSPEENLLPHLQVDRVRSREGQGLVQGHQVKKQQN